MSDALREHLSAALAQATPPALGVAFSGGPDSTALLHAFAQLPQAREAGLRALHVDHGLHPASADWAAHCRKFCVGLDVPCDVLTVHVERKSGDGLEAAARGARYAALAGAMREGEWLATGQHRDDQAETVLLKLLRGAGPEGLAGMRELRPLGRGQLWRPLLELPRQTLADYVTTYELASIDDPSNLDRQLSRNHLRHDILPRLIKHWPQAVQSIVHSAALCRAADDVLQRQWREAFEHLHDPATGSLSVAAWLALPPALRQPLLDHWLHARGLRAPTTAQRQQIEAQCHARAGRVPCIRWGDTELHIWKERLWSVPVMHAFSEGWEAAWDGSELSLPDGGTLTLHPQDARLANPLKVRLRRGGERLRPLGDAHTRELRDLFQQAQVPPWRRLACPLIHAGDELVAVADRWCNARGVEIFAAARAQPLWTFAR